MRKHRRTVALVVLAASLFAAPASAGQRARTGSLAAKTVALLAAVVDIEAGRRTTPLIGEPHADGSATVTFLARRGGGPVPRIISDVTGWGERPDDTFDFKSGTMSRVGRTDWYWLETTVAARARIEYLVAHGLRDYRGDPYNPRRTAIRGTSPASEFVMPGYVPPEEFEDAPVTPAGRVTPAAVDSPTLGEERRAIVYTPPDYRDDGEYALAVFHGGTNVADSGVGPRVLDWLIARHAIEPTVAVFVDSWPRVNDEEELARLRAFLAGELLEWVGSRYAVSARANRRAILGISFGARDALDAAVRSDAFGLVGLLIPGRRMTPADIRALAGEPRHRVRLTILGGLYDAPNLSTARMARKAFAHAGHRVDYIEVPEGHNQGTWRNHLRDVLVSLFGTNQGPEHRR